MKPLSIKYGRGQKVVGLPTEGKVTKFSNRDTDKEHLSRSILPPPRVMNPFTLNNFGFDPGLVYDIYSFMQTMKLYGDKVRCKLSPHTHSGDGSTFENPFASKSGQILIELDDSIGKAIGKGIISPNSLPKQHRVELQILMTFLAKLLEDDFSPKYVHFIAHKDDFDFLERTYFEVLIVGTLTRSGNVFADFQDGDNPSKNLIII